MPFDIANIAADTAGKVIDVGMGLALEGHNDRRQLRQQEKLNQQQIAANMEMAKWNYEQQYEMWKKTGYTGQMEQMKKAGINPALMYGMGGGGGQTTGSAGMGVSGGGAPSGGGEVMGAMGMGLAMKMQEAQIKVMESQANKNNVEATKTAGVDTSLAQTQQESLTQNIQNQKALELLTRTENRLKEFDADYAGKTINKRIEGLEYTVGKTWKELDILTSEAWVAADTIQTKIDTAKTELVGLTLRNILTDAQTSNTRADTNLKGVQANVGEQQIKKMVNDIMIGWDGLGLEQKRIRLQEVMTNFNTDVTREVKNDIMGVLESILQYKMHTTPQTRVTEHINRY